MSPTVPRTAGLSTHPAAGLHRERTHPNTGGGPACQIRDSPEPMNDSLWTMSSDSYRGFTFQTYDLQGPDTGKRALRASRGCITLFVEVSEGDLPSGWRLRDILEYEINRLLEPTTLRHVEHLN